MADESKTKAQLREEVKALRQRVADLQAGMAVREPGGELGAIGRQAVGPAK